MRGYKRRTSSTTAAGRDRQRRSHDLKAPLSQGASHDASETSANEQQPRRKRFRFSRKDDDQQSESGESDQQSESGESGDAVLEYVDQLADRIEELAEGGGSEHAPSAAAVDAHASQDAELRPTTPARPAPAADAAMAPATTSPQPAAPPRAERAPDASAPSSIPQPPRSPADQIALDTHRIMRLVEQEAKAVRVHIGQQLLEADERAQSIVHEAEAQAEHVREHAQQHARQLLGEVEEIITESQQTGEDILARAHSEAAAMRRQAEHVLAQAQEDSRKVIDSARREGEQILSDQRRLATVRAQEAMREHERLKDQIRRLEERRRQVLESLEQLSEVLLSQRGTGGAGTSPQNVVQMPR